MMAQQLTADEFLLIAIKKEFVTKKVARVKVRLQLGDLTIEESGVELAFFLREMGSITTLEEMGKWKDRQHWL